jgi:hypothetical protein
MAVASTTTEKRLTLILIARMLSVKHLSKDFLYAIV